MSDTSPPPSSAAPEPEPEAENAPEPATQQTSVEPEHAPVKHTPKPRFCGKCHKPLKGHRKEGGCNGGLGPTANGSPATAGFPQTFPPPPGAQPHPNPIPGPPTPMVRPWPVSDPRFLPPGPHHHVPPPMGAYYTPAAHQYGMHPPPPPPAQAPAPSSSSRSSKAPAAVHTPSTQPPDTPKPDSDSEMHENERAESPEADVAPSIETMIYGTASDSTTRGTKRKRDYVEATLHRSDTYSKRVRTLLNKAEELHDMTEAFVVLYTARPETIGQSKRKIYVSENVRSDPDPDVKERLLAALASIDTLCLESSKRGDRERVRELREQVQANKRARIEAEKRAQAAEEKLSAMQAALIAAGVKFKEDPEEEAIERSV